MNTHPSEAVQDGRTEFWENLRDKKLEEHKVTSEAIRLWWPIDALQKRRVLRHIEQFIIRATVIIDESRQADHELELQCQAKASPKEQSTPEPWNEIEIPSLNL